jgi:hypothetical protein
VNPTTTLNVVQLAKQQLAALDAVRRAERDLASLKARDPPATEDELTAEQKILDDAQLKYSTLTSIETVPDNSGGGGGQ